MIYVLMCGSPDARTPYSILEHAKDDLSIEDLKAEWIASKVGKMPHWSRNIETRKIEFDPPEILTMQEYGRKLRMWRWHTEQLKAADFVRWLVDHQGFVQHTFIQEEIQPLMEFD